MTARKTSEIQEVLRSAYGKKESLQLSENLLQVSLTAAMTSLQGNYHVKDPFVPAGNDSTLKCLKV